MRALSEARRVDRAGRGTTPPGLLPGTMATRRRRPLQAAGAVRGWRQNARCAVTPQWSAAREEKKVVKLTKYYFFNKVYQYTLRSVSHQVEPEADDGETVPSVR